MQKCVEWQSTNWTTYHVVTPTFQMFLIMIRVPPTKSLIVVHLSLFILSSTLPPPHRLQKMKAPTKQVLDLMWLKHHWMSMVHPICYYFHPLFTDRVIFVRGCEVGGRQRTLTRTRGIENNKDLRGHMRSWPPGFAIFQDASLLQLVLVWDILHRYATAALHTRRIIMFWSVGLLFSVWGQEDCTTQFIIFELLLELGPPLVHESLRTLLKFLHEQRLHQMTLFGRKRLKYTITWA